MSDRRPEPESWGDNLLMLTNDDVEQLLTMADCVDVLRRFFEEEGKARPLGSFNWVASHGVLISQAERGRVHNLASNPRRW